jgi:hypothetical protein
MSQDEPQDGTATSYRVPERRVGVGDTQNESRRDGKGMLHPRTKVKGMKGR